MSRNSKNAKRIQAAKEMSKARQGGSPGPARTQAKHGKKNAWWQKGDYSSFVKGGKKTGRAQVADEAVPV
jgi:hypothetical protein